MFDARDPDSLQNIKEGYNYANYYSPIFAIMQVIALRVSTRPNPGMIKTINEVERWAVDKKVRFAKFADDSAT